MTKRDDDVIDGDVAATRGHSVVQLHLAVLLAPPQSAAPPPPQTPRHPEVPPPVPLQPAPS